MDKNCKILFPLLIAISIHILSYRYLLNVKAIKKIVEIKCGIGPNRPHFGCFGNFIFCHICSVQKWPISICPALPDLSTLAILFSAIISWPIVERIHFLFFQSCIQITKIGNLVSNKPENKNSVSCWTKVSGD